MYDTSRRDLLKTLSHGLGCAALAPFVANAHDEASGNPTRRPKRFVFVVKSNGLLPYGIQPVELEGRVNGPANTTVRTKEMKDLALGDCTLNATMAGLEPLKRKVNVVQGLSAQMCGGNHSAVYGAMGAYPMRDGGSPKDATIDAILANAFPGIFPHLGLMLAPHGKKVVNPRLSAAAPGKPIAYYADPLLAYSDLFGAAAAGDGKVAARSELDRSLLDFMVDDIKRLNGRLPTSEREKLGHYLEGFEALRNRRARIAGMRDAISKGAPEADDRFRSVVETDRLEAHFDVAAAALVTGLTNVVAINPDRLETRYTGLGLGDYNVHAYGHMEVNGRSSNSSGTDPNADESNETRIVSGQYARNTIRKCHFDLVAGLARKLDAVPEGDGTMLDNTLILYFSHSGDRHHPNFFTWPIVTVGGLGGSIRTGRYLQYPSHGERGHHTLGNFYTTLLHAVGMPRDGFGHADLGLGPEIDQTCPLDHLLA